VTANSSASKHSTIPLLYPETRNCPRVGIFYTHQLGEGSKTNFECLLGNNINTGKSLRGRTFHYAMEGKKGALKPGTWKL
jgi:hypothetical protein